jgi:glycosyltransferase involved in cell wall biosynthesis
MKIAIVTNAFTHYRLKLFEKLACNNGHEITVFKYADWWDAKSSYVEVKKWKSIGFKIPFLIDDIYFHFSWAVLWAIAHREWDAIIGYGYGSLTTWIVALIARHRKIPFILWSDARLEYEITRAKITRWSKLFLHSLSDQFVASGNSSLLHLMSMKVEKSKITLAPYAIDNEVLFKEYMKWKSVSEKIRNDMNISNRSVVILYVGRLVEEKGINELITAFSYMPLDPGKTLVLVGDGKDRTAFEKMAEKFELKNIIFTGHVPHDDVAKYFAIGDIFVLPSYKDVWGLVINEAMVCGLPVITTCEVGAWRDLVQSEKNGYVIKPRDVDALKKVLTKLCKDSGMRYAMGRQSRHIIKQWDIGHAINKIERVLQEYNR